ESFRNPSFDLVSLRRRLRMSQTEFAHRFGLPLGTLRHWESGKRRPGAPAISLLQIIAYNPGVATRAISRARRATQVRPEPRIRPPILPIERENPTELDADIDP